jgi:hypothetical protein
MKTILINILLLFFIYSGVKAQTEIPKAQAMYIYNFCRLIEWPASYKTGDFVIGVLGVSTVYDELVAFTTGKKVGTQEIKIVRFKEPVEITKCQILFVSFGKSPKIAEIIGKVGSNSTLIITEKNGMIDTGAGINFIVDGDKLKFELRNDNVSKYGLKVSSSLLNMAIVK